MKDKLLKLLMRFFIHNGCKKEEFYRKHHYFHSQGEECYIPVYISKRESYLISLGNIVWLEKITSPFWRKLQWPVQSLREPLPATADIW